MNLQRGFVYLDPDGNKWVLVDMVGTPPGHIPPELRQPSLTGFRRFLSETELGEAKILERPDLAGWEEINEIFERPIKPEDSTFTDWSLKELSP